MMPAAYRKFLKGTPAEILAATFELCPRLVSDQWDLKIKQRKETDKVSLVRDQTTASTLKGKPTEVLAAGLSIRLVFDQRDLNSKVSLVRRPDDGKTDMSLVGDQTTAKQ